MCTLQSDWLTFFFVLFSFLFPFTIRLLCPGLAIFATITFHPPLFIIMFSAFSFNVQCSFYNIDQLLLYYSGSINCVSECCFSFLLFCCRFLGLSVPLFWAIWGPVLFLCLFIVCCCCCCWLTFFLEMPERVLRVVLCCCCCCYY